MAIFGPKPQVNPFRKMSIFRLFKLLVFIAQKGVFSFYNIIKDISVALIAKKKNFKNWPFLDQKPGLTSLEKCRFFDFLEFFFYSLDRRFFVLEYHNRHFPGLYCPKKKVRIMAIFEAKPWEPFRKMAIFRPKPWVNPFGKISIFRHFELLVFIAQKSVFTIQNIIKDIFLVYIA